MNNIDAMFARLNQSLVGHESLIACLYTGVELPTSCAPMLRSPAPRVGQVLDDDFIDHLTDAMALNYSVHDGAIMLGRRSKETEYRVTGWSYRLFPSVVSIVAEENKGSAFNSCFAMSEVPRVDRLYLLSHRKLWKFQDGSASELTSTPSVLPRYEKS